MRVFNLLLLLFFFASASAQQVFIKSGSIEFERSINVKNQIESNEYGEYYKSLLVSNPPFYTSGFILYFDSTHTLYKPLGEPIPFSQPLLLGPAKDNVVFTDKEKQLLQSSKKIYEEKYNITDSTGKIKWKITDESREIAGFNCRKAVGIICDSVYVTAFYADEIISSGGPESFNGLPGMILGIGIPRLHTTWFATKIHNTPPATGIFNFSFKGKTIDPKQLEVTLRKTMSDWGKAGPRNIWWTFL